MIIWINGAFGAGKTQSAFELNRRIENSYVYDPENVGYFIQKNMPQSIHKSDFQHYPMWRSFNYSMLKHLDHDYKGTIIVPMTVVNVDYFNEIAGKLREDNILINHFTLCASKERLLKRLKSRGDGNQSWAAQQIDRCMAGLADETFQHHIDTEHMTVSDNVAYIAERLSISLIPDNRGAVRRVYDRVKTQFQQIRF